MLTLSQILVVHNGKYGRNVQSMRRLQLELRELDLNLHSLMMQNVPSIELNRRMLQNQINTHRFASILQEAAKTQGSRKVHSRTRQLKTSVETLFNKNPSRVLAQSEFESIQKPIPMSHVSKNESHCLGRDCPHQANVSYDTVPTSAHDMPQDIDGYATKGPSAYLHKGNFTAKSRAMEQRATNEKYVIHHKPNGVSHNPNHNANLLSMTSKANTKSGQNLTPPFSLLTGPTTSNFSLDDQRNGHCCNRSMDSGKSNISTVSNRRRINNTLPLTTDTQTENVLLYSNGNTTKYCPSVPPGLSKL